MNENIPTPVCDLRAVRMLSYSQSGVELYVHVDYARELERRAIQAEHGLLESEKCVQHLTKRVESLLVIVGASGERVDRILRDTTQ